MMSKLLFFVLLGCAVALASPVQRDASKEVETHVEEHELTEEEAQEIIKAIEEKLNEILKNADETMTDEDIKNALAEVKELVDKIFGQRD